MLGNSKLFQHWSTPLFHPPLTPALKSLSSITDRHTNRCLLALRVLELVNLLQNSHPPFVFPFSGNTTASHTVIKAGPWQSGSTFPSLSFPSFKCPFNSTPLSMFKTYSFQTSVSAKCIIKMTFEWSLSLTNSIVSRLLFIWPPWRITLYANQLSNSPIKHFDTLSPVE